MIQMSQLQSPKGAGKSSYSVPPLSAKNKDSSTKRNDFSKFRQNTENITSARREEEIKPQESVSFRKSKTKNIVPGTNTNAQGRTPAEAAAHRNTFLQQFFWNKINREIENQQKTQQPQPVKSKSKGKNKKRSRSKSLKNRRMPKNTNEIDDTSGLLCELCNKELPVLFYKNEDLVKRMPDHTLNPFLKAVKNDLFNNEQYLKYLRVSSKFIRPCLCKKPVHTYCITAQVIRSGCVCCKVCKQQYKLFVKEEQICSPKLIRSAGYYICFNVIGLILYVGFIIIDAQLKHNYFKDNPEIAKKVGGRQVLYKIDVLPDYANQESFSFINSVRWGAIFPFAVIVFIIMTWLLYFTFDDVVLARKKVVYAEVRPKDEKISRTQSKINLNILLQTSEKRNKFRSSSLFDKHYYEQRENQRFKQKQSKHGQDGFVFDALGLVASSYNFKSSAGSKVRELPSKENVVQNPSPRISVKQLKPIIEEGSREIQAIQETTESPLLKEQQTLQPQATNLSGANLEDQNNQNSQLMIPHKQVRSGSIVSFGKQESSGNIDEINQSRKQIQKQNSMQLMSSSALLTKANQLAEAHIGAENQSQSNKGEKLLQLQENFNQQPVQPGSAFNQYKYQRDIEVSSPGLSNRQKNQSADTKPLPSNLEVKAQQRSLSSHSNDSKKQSARHNKLPVKPLIKKLSDPNIKISQQFRRDSAPDNYQQENQSTKDLVDAIKQTYTSGDLSQNGAMGPGFERFRAPSIQFDTISEAQPKQHPDFDNISEINNTSATINPSKRTTGQLVSQKISGPKLDQIQEDQSATSENLSASPKNIALMHQQKEKTRNSASNLASGTITVAKIEAQDDNQQDDQEQQTPALQVENQSAESSSINKNETTQSKFSQRNTSHRASRAGSQQNLNSVKGLIENSGKFEERSMPSEELQKLQKLMVAPVKLNQP